MGRKTRFPCGICEIAVRGGNSIECSRCRTWIHADCYSITNEVFRVWKEQLAGVAFYCKNCATVNHKYNIEAAFTRINSALNTSQFKCVIASERLLLRTYDVSLPISTYESTPDLTDTVSVDILQKVQPCILEEFIPLHVEGDGNCLFRAVSKGLYGDEIFHLLLCLFTALEIGITLKQLIA